MDALTLARCFVCLFFAVCLLQSGLDKFFDWKGNVDYLKDHFSKTVFKGSVPPMLASIALLETVAGALCGASIVLLLTRSSFAIAGMELPTIAMSLVCLDFCMLLLGQRIAKDYAGSASLATYFAVALIGLYSMAPLR